MFVRKPFTFKEGNNHEGFFYDIYRAFKGNISYGDGTNKANIDGVWATVANTGLANTDIQITHNLDRIPVGFHIISKDQAGDFYKGVGVWTNRLIFLRCSVANVTNVKIFIF